MYQKSQSYDVRFLRHGVRQTKNFVILGHFLPFQPHDNLENRNFKIKKKKKTLRDNIILRICTINDNHMIPEIWHGTDRLFCHSGPFFALYPPMDPENQNFERKKKKTPEDIILQKCTINDSHIMYGS